MKSTISQEQLQQCEVVARESLHALGNVIPELYLNDVQTTVFILSWCQKSYQEIADDTGYSVDYLKDVGYKLWKILTEKLDLSVSKSNIRSSIRQYLNNLEQLPGSMSLSKSKLKQDTTSYDLPLSSDWADVSDLPIFVGRETELTQMETWVLKDNQRLLGIFGLGGTGKTAMCIRFAQKWQEYFDCVIWRSMRNQPEFSSFVKNLVYSLSTTSLPSLPDSPSELVSMLIYYLSQHHCLLVLDDWWPLFASKKNTGCYAQEFQAYGLLLRRLGESRHGSQILITSRERPSGLLFKESSKFPVRSLQINHLDKKSANKLLMYHGLSPKKDDLDALWETYSGNTYALKVAASTIDELFDGDIKKFIDQKDFIYSDIKRLLQQQYNRLTDIEKKITLRLADKNGWIKISDIEKDISKISHRGSFLEALESLSHRSFILREKGQVCQPNIISKFVIKQASH